MNENRGWRAILATFDLAYRAVVLVLLAAAVFMLWQIVKRPTFVYHR